MSISGGAGAAEPFGEFGEVGPELDLVAGLFGRELLGRVEHVVDGRVEAFGESGFDRSRVDVGGRVGVGCRCRPIGG